MSNVPRQPADKLQLNIDEQPPRVGSVLDVVTDGVLTVREDGAVVDMNPAAEALLGVRLGEARGRPFTTLLSDLAPPLSMRELFERSGAYGGIDARAQDARGATIPVHVTVSAAVEREANRYIIVMRDFRTIHFAQQRALETERLAAIGETMTALAHESRNALQRMQSCLTLLQLRGDSEVQELVADMQDAQDQLRRLYEEVKDFAAPLQLSLAPIDVGELLDEVWRQLEVEWTGKHLVYSKRDQADRPCIQGDALRIGQVFRNVLENAIEASPHAGRISVTLTPNGVEQRPGVRVTVDDQGPGIPERMRPQVFTLLFTTKPGGTGMGLAIARRVVKEHSGEISVQESPLGGARIVVGLPNEQSPGRR
jgi:PAS domain S-box-containing protein